MTRKISITDNLRAQQVDIEGLEAELKAERDEISYLALIDKDNSVGPASISLRISANVPVDAVIKTWATSIRNRINAAIGEKPAKAA